jgi:methylamine--corrinoid protein Co-methyltransferase
MGEVGHAVTRQGLTLGQANSLVLQLLAKYEAAFDRPGGNPGRPFNETYDLATLRPIPAWEQMYRKVKAELRQMGLHDLN